MKVVVNGKTHSLLDSHYKAEGGQAKIYVKDGLAFKLFHDPKKMIPAGKIRELAQIKLPNVLAPQDVITDVQGKELGFTMPSASDFEFLCKLFSKGFRNRNKLSPDDIIHLVREMQVTLQKLHDQNFLVVDYNEMNFLVDSKTFKTPFYIDVDSYQTPSYPASALMESVRDRKAPKNKFSPLTDWFSWAVVTFKLYIGAHPYGGNHPNFSGEGVLDARMDAGISVFDPAIQLPPACQDLSVIPKSHLEWYKRVFVHGERSIPPMPDAVAVVAQAVAKIISGNEKFAATLIESFGSEIMGIEVIAGSRYYLTDAAVYQEKVEALSFSSRKKIRGIIPVMGSTYAIAELDKQNSKVLFCDKQKNLIGEVGAETDDFMVANGAVYTICKGNLIESSFVHLGVKEIHQTQIVGTVFAPTAKLYDGVALQDMLGKAYALIPFRRGSATMMAIPELNGQRIIDAKYTKSWLVVMGEHGGKYTRFVFKIDPATLKYTFRKQENVDMDSVSFAVLDNGLCIMTVNDKRIEAFFDNQKVKTVDNPPFDSEDSLYAEGNSVMVIKGSKLYKISLK